jgi:hypothetical protein
MVNGGKKRTTMTHSEGCEAEVDGLRKRTTMARSEGGRVEVDGLRKRMTMARSEVRVEAVACSKAGDEAAASSGTGIEDGRRQQHRR